MLLNLSLLSLLSVLDLGENVKGEAKVLLSFVASQTMIYIVFAVTLLICQKAPPFQLKLNYLLLHMNSIYKRFIFRVASEVVNSAKEIASYQTGNLKKRY